MQAQIKAKSPLIIAISGSSGFIGEALCRHFEEKGHIVKRLVRRRPAIHSSKEIYWNPDSGHIETHALEGVHVVIHLAAKNIADQRWTNKHKKAFLESRINGTKLISRAISRLKIPPFLFLSASATGYYGDREEEILDESSKPGTGFLAEVCREWENATAAVQRTGIPVVHLRTSMVLSANDGALARMLPPFRLGLGGFLGTGKQYISWITLEDEVNAIEHIVQSHLKSAQPIEGPVNLASPNPVPNIEFCLALAESINRPCALAVPAFALRLLYGEIADAVLLASCRARPEKLLNSGFVFTHAKIKDAFDALLHKR